VYHEEPTLTPSFSLAYMKLCPCTVYTRLESALLTIFHLDSRCGDDIQMPLQGFQRVLPKALALLFQRQLLRVLRFLRVQKVLVHHRLHLAPHLELFRLNSMDMPRKVLHCLAADLKL
jgi:hypothetical protein